MAHIDDSELESINWTISVIMLEVAESNNVCGDAYGQHSWSSYDGPDPQEAHMRILLIAE